MKYLIVVLAMLAVPTVTHADPYFNAQAGYHVGNPMQVTPNRKAGVYKPQPLKKPVVKRVGPPKCGDKGHWDSAQSICVANQITRIDIPQEYKDYLAGCQGVIKTRTIWRDGVLVEQQGCFPN